MTRDKSDAEVRERKGMPESLCRYPNCGQPRSAEVHHIIQCLPDDHPFVGEPTSSEQRELRELLLPLRNACDRDWKDETPAQTVEIAANAIYWRDREIEKATGECQRLREALRDKSDRAYCDYIDQLKKPECLGWEAKVKSGTFGEDELVGHCIAQELLGKHKAFAEALTLLGASPELS